MKQKPPLYEFEDEVTVPVGGRGRWLRRSIVLVLAIVIVAGFGYGLGRGTWAIPSAISDRVPEPLARLLPRPSSGSETSGMPVELKDYAFALIEPQVKQGDAVLAVRLVRRSTDKPVSDAIVFARRLDMAPSGMTTMTAELEPQPATEPGVYRFKTDLTMAGDWQLSLAAKVQGEIGTVQNQLALKAVP